MRELFDASAFSPLNSQSLEGTTIASQDVSVIKRGLSGRIERVRLALFA
jgi:hypothetical protein